MYDIRRWVQCPDWSKLYRRLRPALKWPKDADLFKRSLSRALMSRNVKVINCWSNFSARDFEVINCWPEVLHGTDNGLFTQFRQRRWPTVSGDGQQPALTQLNDDRLGTTSASWQLNFEFNPMKIRSCDTTIHIFTVRKIAANVPLALRRPHDDHDERTNVLLYR